MKKITLVQGKINQGKVVLVDDWNYDWLNQYKWFARKTGNNWYAVRNKVVRSHSEARKMGTSTRHTCIYMHRFIMNAPGGMDIDHINHNTLNNQKDNLRICSPSQNRMNQLPRRCAFSKYKGVGWHKQKKG